MRICLLYHPLWQAACFWLINLNFDTGEMRTSSCDDFRTQWQHRKQVGCSCQGGGGGGCLQNTSVTRPGASRLSTFHSLKSGDNSPPMFLSRPFIPRQSLRLRSWQSVGVSRHAEVHHWGAGQGPHGGGHSQSLGNPLSSQTRQTGIGIDIISHSRHAQERSEVTCHLLYIVHYN